jgi:hypothetical protein
MKMKKFKFVLYTVALASVVAFSSCLGDSEESDFPAYRNVGVTVGAGGFKLLADNGSYLIPRSMVQGLENVERAAVSFNLASGEALELKPGQTYDVIVNTAYSYGIPTYPVIDLWNNEQAKDSLVNSQTGITRVGSMYAVHGYVTLEATVPYSQSETPYVDVAYNSKEDVDVEGKKLTLTFYYDAKSSYTSQTASGVFSFRLPAPAATAFYESQTDSIDLVMKYQTGMTGLDQGQATCRMAVKDLVRPTF